MTKVRDSCLLLATGGFLRYLDILWTFVLTSLASYFFFHWYPLQQPQWRPFVWVPNRGTIFQSCSIRFFPV